MEMSSVTVWGLKPGIQVSTGPQLLQKTLGEAPSRLFQLLGTPGVLGWWPHHPSLSSVITPPFSFLSL